MTTNKIKVNEEEKKAILDFENNDMDLSFFAEYKERFSDEYESIKGFSVDEMAIILYGVGYEVIKKDSKEMKLNEYQELSKRTFPKDKTYEQNMVNFTLGLTGESGEVADALKKGLNHGHDLDIDELKKELGDILFYISSMTTLLGSDLSEIAEMNVKKLEDRYPNGFSEEASRNRKE